MIKYLNLVLVLTLMVAGACKESEKETPNGMKYTVLSKGDGKTPEPDQILVFDFQMKDSNDSLWASTYEDGVPAASLIADTSRIREEDGVTQMFRMLSKGDSVTTTMSIKTFFKDVVHAPLPPAIDSSLDITYTVKVRDITLINEYQKMREGQILQRDTKNIDKYLRENSLTSKRDSSGLQFIIHNEAGGKKPNANSCVEVKYEGRFLKNGRIFDKAEKISFPLYGVIEGWKLAIPMLGVGDSATFFIPSKLAYGPQGYPGAIPPDAVLIFDVTLLAVKDQFDPDKRICK